MTLIIDSNEHRNHPSLLPLLQAAGVPCDVGRTNQNPHSTLIYPDFLIWEGMVGINRKTVNEWLSSSDKVVEQIQRELVGPINHLALIIEGVMKPFANGMEALEFDWIHTKMFGVGQHGSVPFRRQQFAINPKHSQNEQTRLEFLGVQVIHTYSLEDTISKLVAFHDMIIEGKPNTILNRLIKSEIGVRGLTPQETQFARLLMSCGANWGEELALTVAALGITSVGELFNYWSQGSVLCDTMVREKANVRTRRIGTAAESRLQNALGYPALRAQEQAAEGTPVHDMSTAQ